MVQQRVDDEDIINDITSRIHFFDRPDGTFDPSRASPEQLWQYGIPPRPDAASFPVLADFWDDLFSYPLKFTDATFALSAVQIPVSARSFAISRGRGESSLNWSGVYIAPRDGKQFTEVYGRWHVPGVNLPGGVLGTTECRSSVWIGLDGARRYFDSTLPQIGSGQEVNPSTGLPYSLWWQWWMRDNPLTYKPFTLPVPVAPGDEILAQLLVLNATRVLFLIKNLTKVLSYPPFWLDAPSDFATGLHQAQVSGATAEWIVERPADPATGIFTLPDYGQVTFTDSYAVQATLPSGGTPGLGTLRTLEGARLVSMYAFSGTPQRRVTLSRPEYPQVNQDQVNYVGP